MIQGLLMEKSGQQGHVNAFAEDVIILIKSTTRHAIAAEANEAPAKVEKWSYKNKFKLSLEKYEVIVIRTKYRDIAPILKPQATNLKVEKEFNVLVITTDIRLTYISNTNLIEEKLAHLVLNLAKFAGEKKGFTTEHQEYFITCCKRNNA
ncbi:hypothetical protein HPB48_003701 [Haemaphysalis longicornis]|uniref:Uncharacterized protein n=1 Tax=Haemaphysalis longicornis TaxID=44386 RepID=A0A9J6FFM8_HAELO|nr:hypothetical protein HPB48_003701 [Haemaphysalis longicornis]